jgi:hypothetical protein
VLKVVPSFDVAECPTLSLFVQQTVVPGAIVSEAGEYERPGPIDTIVSPDWHGPGAAGATVGAPPARPNSDSSAMISARPTERHTER